MDGWMDGWSDGRTDGSVMGGWMESWIPSRGGVALLGAGEYHISARLILEFVSFMSQGLSMQYAVGDDRNGPKSQLDVQSKCDTW